MKSPRETNNKPEKLVELHSHLYGCLNSDDLLWLSSRNKPRWEIFVNSYQNFYGSRPRIEDLFHNTSDSQKLLENYLHLSKPASFPEFQVCFDLIISLSSTDPDELFEISKRVVEREVADICEYRMMFSPLLTKNEYKEKTIALAEGIRAISHNSSEKKLSLAISISRENGKCREQYSAVREAILESSAAREFITGIDFCNSEEGFPPSEKLDIFRDILDKNKKNPESSLALLYHVGETYSDKSPESAIRWILEASKMGAHRLGHAIALGMDPAKFLNTTRQETVRERLAQIEFELKYYNEIDPDGNLIDENSLRKEQITLNAMGETEKINIIYDKKRVLKLENFQQWAAAEVKKTGAVIESCPTSNLYIAGIKSPEHLPIPRFLRYGLPVAICTDDPGILNTNLHKEYSLAEKLNGVTEADIKKMKKTAFEAQSEKISGRENKTSEQSL